MALKWTLRMLNIMQEMREAWLQTQRDVWLEEIFLTTVPACCLTKRGCEVRVDGKGVISARS